MYLEGMVDSCDWTGKQYDGWVKGAHIIVPSAVGRCCAVMFAGPEWLEEQGIVPMTEEQVLAEIDAHNATIPEGVMAGRWWPDF